eukprot:CAMPEP_0119308704 /NCGR_PEP_ID=MMETSP1333-20130426/12246_1 /TAXON_ID=418940 /ORGANISM="Scyphosphaera apsteinii, Strain RCC1455" /LENGTH=257 /DNA_ID=CAMNT_0007312537 /DNA_START=32 /DNA_END=804 /DNA_ORIENTATION=+
MSDASPQVHMRYFAVQGAAETLRHVMALGGIEWSEDEWPVDFSKYSTEGIRGAAPGFAKAQDAGELDANLSRGPVCIIDNQPALGQSKALERYLARRLGLMGSTEMEAAQIDAISEHVRDIKDKYQKAKGDPDQKAEYFAKTMPDFMQKIEKAVGLLPGSGPALVGKQLSLADVTLYVFLVDFFTDKKEAMASINNCPRLKASIAAIAAEPNIVKYREAAHDDRNLKQKLSPFRPAAHSLNRWNPQRRCSHSLSVQA